MSGYWTIAGHVGLKYIGYGGEMSRYFVDWCVRVGLSGWVHVYACLRVCMCMYECMCVGGWCVCVNVCVGGLFMCVCMCACM